MGQNQSHVAIFFAFSTTGFRPNPVLQIGKKTRKSISCMFPSLKLVKLQI